VGQRLLDIYSIVFVNKNVIAGVMCYPHIFVKKKLSNMIKKQY